MQDVKHNLMQSALPHVVFDGWTAETFASAIRDSGVDAVLAHAACPRGAVDLAVVYHIHGDDLMAAAFEAADTDAMKIREKVTFAVRARLEVADKEAVRRGTTLFALPHLAGDGAKLIWGTVDRIWTLLGDTSEDVNWYTKRATLAAVYTSVVIYWLGDESEDQADTWAFLDRRIENVMQFEKFKAQVRGNKALSSLMAGPAKLLERVRKPDATWRDDLPGSR
ncbi:MAG: COQ9 family protein [Planktomarina sp.]